jgi:hypothetical protein
MAMYQDNNERHEKKELNYVTDEGLNVPILFEALMIKYMGSILDMARISDMSDRTLTQFSRNIKDSCYNQIKFAKAILKENGIE